MSQKISLATAILININIMLGGGIFFNTAILAERAGALGFLSYAILGILMLPLILAISDLVQRYPEEGFYGYAAKTIHPFAGFISAWSYFIGKLGSCTIMIHASVLLLQRILPLLHGYNPLHLDLSIIGLFLFLNMQNIRTSTHIQQVFFAAKMVPIVFAILCGFYFFHGSFFIADAYLWSGIPTTIPFVLYGVIGFEAACLLSKKLENAERNGPLAIIISFCIVIALTILYQLAFYGALGTLLQQAHFTTVFPQLIHLMHAITPELRHTLISIVHLGIASSALGGAYGILFSNSWNMYTLAEHNHVFFSSRFRTLNKHDIPLLCLLLEGAIVLLYLWVTHGSQVPLQQLGSFGCSVAYTMSIAALITLYAQKNISGIKKWIALLASGTCALLLSSCMYNFYLNGVHALYAFLILLIVGASMYLMVSEKN